MVRKLLLLLVFSLYSKAFSQGPIKPFNLDNVEWNILSCMWNAGPPYVYYFNHYRVCGDTVYQGTKYKRIFEGIASWYPPFMGMTPSKPYPQPTSYSFYGFLKQDSLLKRNYLRLPSWVGDSLLVDYDLQIGDTIKKGLYYNQMAMGPCWGSQAPVVINTDTIQISGQKFKIYYTDSLGGQSYSGLWPMPVGYFFIEGLGHINGIFESVYAQEYYCHPFENCVGVDTVIFNCDCSNLSGINEMQGNKKVEIYPAPAENTIRFNRPISGKIIINNSLGKKILEIACNNCNEIDIASLPKGLYFLDLVEGNLSLRRKIIKS